MNPKILVIDSHPVYINKTEGFLLGLTFQNIVLAATGKKGIEKVEQEQPDLVILSGMLPDMDSHEVCQTIKNVNPSLKIIVQVGLFTSDEDNERFKRCGANIVLDRKEKDLKPLQDSVEELLGLSRS